MKNKREFIVSIIVLLIGGLITYLFLQNSSSLGRKSQIIDKNVQSPLVIGAQTASLNSDGKIDTVQLLLLFKNGVSGSPKKNAKLVLIEDGKEISSKDVTLENNFGKLELVNLFNDRNQQILFTTGVGAHSVNSFLYQIKNNTFVSICPDDSKEDKKQGLDCLFFSDGANIYPEDLDGDGVKEIIASGHAYYNSQSADAIYKWNGSIYKTITGTQYEKLLAVLKAKK